MDSLRERRREKNRHRAALRYADERGSFGSDSIHHGPHVVHAVLESGNVSRAVAQPRTNLVERDHSSEPRYSFEPRSHGAPLLKIERPAEVRHKPRDEHDVDRTVADNRICNVQIIPARIADTESHAHILTQ